MSKQIFPNDLIAKSHTERLDYFKNHTATHTFFKNAFQELSLAIQDTQPGTLIFLYGPSGVGKTTMLKLLEAVLTKQLLKQLETDLERIPIINLSAVETDSGSFDWKDFFQRLLMKLNDPVPEKKLDLTLPNQTQKLLETSDRGTTRKYRRAVENLLQYRRPIAVLLDEAQHIGKVVSSRKLLNQLNVVKCLANESNSIYVLSGTYELTPFLNLNDQLSRRSINIEFPRYKVEIKEEREIFINTLRTFQEFMPLEETPNLISYWDYFYERTIGCIGTLKDWLERSLSLALRDGGKELKFEHCEKRSPLLSQCQKKFLEVSLAENELKKENDDWKGFRKKIGFYESDEVDENKIPHKDKSLIKKKRRVGIRNPKRDPSGKLVLREEK